MADALGAAEAKRRFSELMSRVEYRGERFVIQRHGRPAAALVSASDLERLEADHEPAPEGLMAAVGAWADLGDGEIDDMVKDIYAQRAKARDRDVDPDL